MEDIMEAIGMAPHPQQEYLQELFKHIPKSSRSCHVVKVRKDAKFVSSDDSCDAIWILISGNVRAMEEQMSGEIYVFSEFQAPYLFGEMEGLADSPSYKATLVASTDCQFIIWPMESYLNWLQNDSQALFLRTRTIMNSILEQAKNARTYLFLDGMERLMLYMTKYYREHAKDETCTIQTKRQQIADQTGFSLKTVNRSIKELADNGLITKKGREIVISEKQYKQLLELIDKKVTK